MTCKTIHCKHCKCPSVFSFDFDIADDEAVCIMLCESCYDTLKGIVLQDVLDTAFQETLRGLGHTLAMLVWFNQRQVATDE